MPLTQDLNFNPCMGTLRTLSLHFDSWDCGGSDDNAESSLASTAYDFGIHIGEWVGQRQSILEKLKLSFENYIGFFPKLDIRNIYYPCLKTLELSCVTLSHNSQVD
jgi:hypothetical protein